MQYAPNTRITPKSAKFRLILISSSILALGACSGFNYDLRDNFGDAFSTSGGRTNDVQNLPAPDDRGIVSYPSYQVVLARRGETVTQVADRLGLDAASLARHNGIAPDVPLRQGELLALPDRTQEPTIASGAIAPSTIDITTLAGDAIDRAEPDAPRTPTTPVIQPGVEPVRHQVERGETAYSVARLYNVSVRSLADWNGLGADLSVREGQQLLIPVAKENEPTAPETTSPGQGTPTPVPPSAKAPLPDPEPEAAAKPQSPDLGATTAAKTQFEMPVSGRIIRDYKKGKNDGIDIAAAAGTAVVAAEAGTVAAITKDVDQVTIVVIRHKGGLLSVYANVEGVTVSKGDKVKRGQAIAKLRAGDPAYVHFEVRKGFESVDPTPYVQ